MKEKVLAVVLARKNSSRLKNKLSKKINGEFVINFFLNRLLSCKNIDDIIVAIPKKNFLFFKKIIKDKNIPFYLGSESNVLKRLYYASTSYGYKYVVRANCDCPLIMPTLIEYNIKKFKSLDYDLFTPFKNNKRPFGSALCIYKQSTLKKISKLAKKRLHKEHIENFCFDNSKDFKILYDEFPKNRSSKLIITLDTKEDLDRINKIYSSIKNFKFEKQLKLLINVNK